MAEKTENQNDQPADALPPGSSAVEVAARCGFGPLSPLVSEVWHGDSKPCVSCGKLVRREAGSCAECGEDLSAAMIRKMRAHAGPWYVLEHVRPFPGVTCERIVRQVRRGVLTRSTIVRGPTTDHQWRFAGETPGLSKYLGLCWRCQATAVEGQSRCSACNVDLGLLSDAPVDAAAYDTHVPPVTADSVALRALAEAAKSFPESTDVVDDGSRIGSVKVWWIIAAMLIVVFAVLFAVVQLRDADTAVRADAVPASPPPSLPRLN